MQGNPPLVKVLTAGDLSATQPAGTSDFHSPGPSLSGAEDSLFHRSPVGNTVLNLVSYRPGYQIGVKFRLSHFLNIQPDPFTNKLLQAGSRFINSLPAPPDNNARAGSINGDEYLVCLAFYLDL